ncbi:MAG: FG-GAP repeat domain-containing protein [Verrucomicrobiales bacterium]
MKNSNIAPRIAVLSLASALALGALAQQKPKKARPPGLRFSVKELCADNNEGCTVGDINKDGVPDITAGEFWYQGPDFTQHPLRKLLPFGADYLENNGEHLVDVNGDGWLDVVSGSFMLSKLSWYENPGPSGKWDKRWVAHALVDTEQVKNENTRMRDLDGDGIGEIIIDSWDENNPLVAWKITPGAEPVVTKILIGEAGSGISNGHGIGFGDVDGDGLEDVIFKNGWYQRPAEGAMEKPWVHHADWSWDHAGSPMLVVDLDADGRNDVIWGDGHNYGLYWMQQREPAADGSTNWRIHTIDKKFSQPHTMVWADLDGDGKPELVTGKRVRAHSGKDPGGLEDPVVLVYKWLPDDLSFKKIEIHRGRAGIGLQIRIADMNADGKLDIVVPGKSGTHILFNEG